MYLVKYDSFCKYSKQILNNPLEIRIKERKISTLQKILNPLYRSQNHLINTVINDYQVEQLFINENIANIIRELNNLDYSRFYTIEHSLNNYLIDYIRDYFDINDVGSKTTSIYIERLKSFFYLNELLFYIENDLTLLATKNNCLYIKSKAKYKKYYHRKWFAQQWEAESQKTIMSLTSLLNIKLPHDVMLDKLNRFTEFILDRLFFIHADFTSKRYKNKPSYQYAYKLCKFFILLYLLKNNKININDNLIQELEFDKDNFLDNLLRNQEELNILDKGLKVINNEIHLISTIDLQHILKSSFFKYFDKNITREFGDLFEDYVHKYCIKNFSNDYKITTAVINCGNIPECKDLKLDIDMTLYDIQKDFYYFIQIKYTLINKPYLKDEIKGICDNKSLKKGIKQLENFHIALEYESFQNKLKDFDIKIKNKNYALILVHTTPQYDFQSIKDIQLYEWNTFRNLLDKGKQTVGNINLMQSNIDELQNSQTLQLKNVDDAINTSILNNPKNFDEEWLNFYNEYQDFKINGCTYLSNIK